MNTNLKINKRVPDVSIQSAGMPETYKPDFTTVLLKNVERVADLQKTTLEILNSQTTDVSEAVQRVLAATPFLPGTVFLDLTRQAVSEWISVQKNVVDLMVQQSAHAVDCANKGTSLGRQSTEVLKELVEQSAERAITAQKITLNVLKEALSGRARPVV